MSEGEGAAVALLKRAVELDMSKRYTEALVCYKEGLQLFLGVVQAITDKDKKAKYRLKASEYLDRSEKVQEIVSKEKENGKYHEHIKIEANSIGNSYNSLFGRFLDETVTTVSVEDPYIRAHHQIVNFLKLCELCVKKCPNMTRISLMTAKDSNEKEQESKLEELQRSLAKEKIVLNWEFSTTLHDRELRLDSGWIIKLGRGLDIFKPPEGKIVLGYFDMDLRKCLETTLDIFYSKK
eukprot:TRINITY_DN22531_c0_g1_i1.p1 TRINITY_DN22531_c0_g1~~TRINITY_DN22531_c0_g1_i1.p1  ORF type:complete len:237 (+),score=77.58 TRINITY_DN22531_c0_g1_i1:43-753(+)